MEKLVDAACMNKSNPTFLKPDGSYLPCCWAATNPDFINYLGAELYSQLNINNYSIDEIMNSQAMKLITEKILSDDPFQICIKICKADTTKFGKDIISSSVIDKDGVNRAVNL